MKIQRVEVIPHGREPLGSYAVIKLFGIRQLNGPAVFQLEPAALGSRAAADWPIDDLRPIGVRSSSGAVELLIGPEITTIGALRPGVAVRFRMPSVEADATIIWPDLMTAGAGTSTFAAPVKDTIDVSGPIAPLHTATVVGGQAVAKNAAPVERGLSRLQRRGTASTKATNVVPTSDASPIPLPSLPEPNPAILPPAVPSRASEAVTISFLPVALGTLIVMAMLVVFLRTTTLEGSGVTLYSALMSSNGPDSTDEITTKPAKLLNEILAVRAVSPSGKDASALSQRQALERASKLLAEAKSPEARAEAAYWLRRALSQEFSEPRLVWAVTHLGTAYASSDGENKPDYDAARLLWNWAADAGDGQAACFLGNLFERGLGVATSGQKARQFYERARQLGGCPGLQQAMARVRNIP